MKPNIIISIVLLVLLFTGCSKGTKVGNTFEKSFELAVDSIAAKNNSWLEFEVEKSQEINLSFSKGEYSNKKYRITAKEYVSDDEPIKIKISTESAGNYNFEMSLVNSSEDVDVDYGNKESIVIPNIEFVSAWKHYLWLFIVGGVLLFGLLTFLGWRNYNNNNPKFEEGYINILFPSKHQIDLAGKRSVDIAKSIESDEFTCILQCQIDEENIEEDYIEVSLPIIESSDDIVLIINNQQIDTTIDEKLKDKDIVVINSSLGDKLVEFTYKK